MLSYEYQKTLCQRWVVDTHAGVCYNDYIMKYAKVIDIEQVKQANAKAGYFWFSSHPTLFFKSHYPQHAYKIGNRAYFTTSEQFSVDTPRLYTVRVCSLLTGDIDTVGEFNKLTYKQAKHLLMQTVKEVP